MKRYILYSMLILSVMSVFSCKKRDNKTTPILSVKGTWTINNIVNTQGQTPSNMTVLVGGMASFTDNGYEFKNNGGIVVESGSYVYTSASNVLSVIPSGVSVFNSFVSSYDFSTELTSTTLQLKVNIANTGKPESILTITLSK